MYRRFIKLMLAASMHRISKNYDTHVTFLSISLDDWEHGHASAVVEEEDFRYRLKFQSWEQLGNKFN